MAANTTTAAKGRDYPVDLQKALSRLLNTTVDAKEKQSTFRGMFYGPSGTGKSVLAAKVMRSLVDVSGQDRILYIDTSEGYVSWRNHPGLSDGIKVMPYSAIEDVRAIAAGIENKIGPYANIKAVILDEASKMTEIDSLRIYEARLAGKYGSKEREKAEDQAGLEGRDYQIGLERFRKMLYDLFNIRGIHVILIAHEKETKDRQGNVIRVAPDFSPKIGKAAKEVLHLVAHVTAKIRKDPKDLLTTKYERSAQVHPSVMVDAKCRLNIHDTSVNADTLPSLIGDWAAFGGEIIEDNTIRPDIDSGLEGSTSEIFDMIETINDTANTSE